MTGNRRAAPSAPGTLATPTHLPNATTTPEQKQPGGHNPKKFMSELRSLHSELDTQLVLHLHGPLGGIWYHTNVNLYDHANVWLGCSHYKRHLKDIWVNFPSRDETV